MTTYDLQIGRTAERQLLRPAREDQVRVVRAIRMLAIDPRPRGFRKLQGYDDVFRTRVGLYRVLYSIAGDALIIVVLKIGHRRDAYRGGG